MMRTEPSPSVSPIIESMSRKRRRPSQSPARKNAPAPQRAAASHNTHDADPNDTRNNMSSRSFVIALVVAAAVLTWYFHGNALPQLHKAVGAVLPDHLFWFDTATVDGIRSAMTKDHHVLLSGAHMSAGMLFTVFAGAAGAAVAALVGPANKALKRTLIWACIAFIPVGIASHIMIDEMLSASGATLVTATAVVGLIRWMLLAVIAVCVIVLPVVWFVTEFRKRWNDPNYDGAK